MTDATSPSSGGRRILAASLDVMTLACVAWVLWLATGERALSTYFAPALMTSSLLPALVLQVLRLLVEVESPGPNSLTSTSNVVFNCGKARFTR